MPSVRFEAANSRDVKSAVYGKSGTSYSNLVLLKQLLPVPNTLLVVNILAFVLLHLLHSFVFLSLPTLATDTFVYSETWCWTPL